jgi:hypothetical protein
MQGGCILWQQFQWRYVRIVANFIRCSAGAIYGNVFSGVTSGMMQALLDAARMYFVATFSVALRQG